MLPPARHIRVTGCPGSHPTAASLRVHRPQGGRGDTVSLKWGWAPNGAAGLRWCRLPQGCLTPLGIPEETGTPQGTPERWARGLAVVIGGFPRFMA